MDDKGGSLLGLFLFFLFFYFNFLYKRAFLESPKISLQEGRMAC